MKKRDRELAQARAVTEASCLRIESDDGELYAKTRRGRSDSWRIHRRGDTTRLGKSFASIDTRNRKAVKAMLEALAPFHLGETL